MGRRTAIMLSVLIVFTSFAVSFVRPPSSVSALSGSDFNAGRIIDDTIFYNSYAMDVGQVQAFLNAKLPTCDTNGAQNYSYYYNGSTGEINNSGSGSWVTTSRATYGQRLADYGGEWRGSRAPYTCLKSKTFDTTAVSGDSLCNGYAGASGESAATVIDKVAKSCGINPQVLLVTLQKEQSLITDDWPFGIQYEKAMGYSCPDNPPAEWAPKNCNPDYLGFHKQVYQAARRLKNYQANPNSYNYVAGRNNQILWNPNSGCGTSTVYIQSQATAALYIYTPYRPNQAALDNLYGTGDGCSSYGVRNFWRMFNDWFGSTWGYTIQSELMTRYNELGGVNGSMGISTDGGYCNSGRTACWQQFKNGFIIYSSATGAWESKNHIRARWAATGYQNGKMGYPAAGEVYDGNGVWSQQFQKGYIVGSEATGYWESMGGIRQRWIQLGQRNGSLGMPVGGEFGGAGDSWWQQYQNGYIMYSPATGAWESKGGIRNYWAKIGYQHGKLGFPTGGEIGLGGDRWSQTYQYGAIVGGSATGYWESSGKIRERWAQLGYHNSSLGLPVGPEISGPNGSWWQRYQTGYIVGNGTTGYWESKGAIRDYWGWIGYQDGKAGWPTGPEVYNSTTQTWSQTYQRGTIYYSSAVQGGWFIPN